ncbi:MAG TPA: helix-hairpin-helix domain-containing protein, partial [Rectinemataceae bacterium]
EERPSLPYDIDGLVVKKIEIDEEDLAKPRPEKQIAFKFDPEEAATTLLEVVWSPSGAVYTPIGIVRPVRLAGTTVQRANLCNPGIIREMGLRIGSRVIITKRGEIIPKIERLLENPESSSPILQPQVCPACGSGLVDEDSRLYCPNELCPNKELHRLEKWLSVLDIRGFGTALVQRLHQSGLVRYPADLYSLDEEKLLGMERMGPLLARKLIGNLLKPRTLGLAEFLAAFDLEGVGMIVAEKLVRGGFDNLEKLRAASSESLASLDGIGEIMAHSIKKSLIDLKKQMDDVLALGIIEILPAPSESSSRASSVTPATESAVSGKSFCFTGELATMRRSDAESLIRSLGGIAKQSVTADLDYLVTNDPGSGSSKNLKARALGVAVITEKEFRALAGL